MTANDDSNDQNKGKEKKSLALGGKTSIGHKWQGRPFTPLENIAVFTVIAGTLLMAVSLFVPRPEATKDVLPFATGLLGFLGGLVTAIYGQKEKGKSGSQGNEQSEKV
jgi:hypothetical protein